MLAARSVRAALLFVSLVPATAIIALAAYYARLAYPQSDDFFRLFELRTHSVLGVVGDEYRNWNTRWLSMLIEVSADQEAGLFARYPWMLLGGLGALYAACCCIVSVLAG